MAITYYTTYTACDCHILLFTLTTISDIAAISILVIFRLITLYSYPQLLQSLMLFPEFVHTGISSSHVG